MKELIKLMRPKHYIKNGLILTALIFSGQMKDLHKLLQCIRGVAAFCAVSSAVYIINDIRDAEQDRLHPTKCLRPIAKGTVTERQAAVLAGVLFLLGGYLGWGKQIWLLLAYAALNLGYSFGWKHIPLMDIGILVSGFLIRVLYGAQIADIQISNWLYLTVVAVAFYFALGKRRNELRRQAEKARPVLKFYSEGFLSSSMTMSLTLGLTFYSLWSMDAGTIAMYGSGLVLTLPLVLIIVLKYSLVVEGNSDGDPVEVLFHDRVLMALCLLYGVMLLWVLYRSAL